MPLYTRSPYGHAEATTVGGVTTRAASSAATLAALAALPATDANLTQGNDVVVDADNSIWIWDSLSTLAADNIFVAGANALGRWVRKAGFVDIALPFTFATADAAVLATIPVGMRIALKDSYWKVTTSFTGGASSAIGASSSNAAASTKGDLLGGAGGDVLATLVSTGPSNFVLGTGGAKLMGTNTQIRACVLVAGDTIRFDRITSAFTAGVGEVHLIGMLEISPTV